MILLRIELVRLPDIQLAVLARLFDEGSARSGQPGIRGHAHGFPSQSISGFMLSHHAAVVLLNGDP
jgi:hypothetical protein